jgi:hypothetical protein
MSFQREADGSLREGHTFANDGRRTGGVTDPLESQDSCRACRLGHDDISSKRFIRPPFSGRLYLMLRLEPEGEWRGLERRDCECENQDCWIELHE